MKPRILALVIAGALGAVGACSLFHGDFPDDKKCAQDSDCFQAQGEKCTADGTCQVVNPADAAPPKPDAKPTPDAPPTPDGGPDAGPDAAVDAGGPDA